MRAHSLPMEKIAALATQAAEQVLADRRKMLGDDLAIGVFPGIGTVGLIARNPNLTQLTAPEMLEVSERITDAMREIEPDAQAVACVFKGCVIAGYFPCSPIEIARLR